MKIPFLYFQLISTFIKYKDINNEQNIEDLLTAIIMTKADIYKKNFSLIKLHWIVIIKKLFSKY